jgi:tetratricopeptide (TPR) repeat protein
MRLSIHHTLFFVLAFSNVLFVSLGYGDDKELMSRYSIGKKMNILLVLDTYPNTQSLKKYRVEFDQMLSFANENKVIEASTSILKEHPNYPAPYYFRAVAYCELNNMEKGLRDYQKASQLYLQAGQKNAVELCALEQRRSICNYIVRKNKLTILQAKTFFKTGDFQYCKVFYD